MMEPRRRERREGREKKKKRIIAIFSWWLSKCRRRSKKDCLRLPIPNIEDTEKTTAPTRHTGRGRESGQIGNSDRNI
ncbi:hypothetical protein [Microcoleus sp. S13_B4]|uniref:hypothetical protein n=1 Tax=Microcoleus sp. S13_B4 TaxID=3055408 RepID=UPI002FD013FB